MARVNQQEPFYSPNAKPALPRQPKPGEHLDALEGREARARGSRGAASAVSGSQALYRFLIVTLTIAPKAPETVPNASPRGLVRRFVRMRTSEKHLVPPPHSKQKIIAHAIPPKM
jgi:hypothetical protein